MLESQGFHYVNAYSFTDEPIPDPIGLVVAEDLNWKDQGKAYAFIHAYRALG